MKPIKQEGPCDTCGIDLDEHSMEELIRCFRKQGPSPSPAP